MNCLWCKEKITDVLDYNMGAKKVIVQACSNACAKNLSRLKELQAEYDFKAYADELEKREEEE